jgi:hypothetical protein
MTDLRNLSKLEDCIVNLPVCDCTRPGKEPIVSLFSYLILSHYNQVSATDEFHFHA